MTEPNLEGLLKIFTFEKKSELRKYCQNAVISSSDFVHLILSCESSGQPFLHKITYKETVPAHLNPSGVELQALENTPAGSYLGPEAAKAVRKMTQSFVERRYAVGHIFHNADLSKWHFFCFDLRDTDTDRNHWKEGSHVHFVNWLWPGQNAESVWSNFLAGNRPADTMHLRTSFENEIA